MKSKRFNHYILTKYNTMPDANGLLLYDKPGADEWMKHRGELFEETKKSVLEQEGGFQWVISVDERTPKRFLDNIKTDDRILLTTEDIRDVFLNGNITLEKSWVITSRLDNDDRYLPGAVLAIQSEFRKQIFVIDFDYQKLDLDSGETHPGVWRWANSPFLSICEPSERVMTAFCRTHGQVRSGYPSKHGRIGIAGKRIKKVYVQMVIHGDNITNAIG